MRSLLLLQFVLICHLSMSQGLITDDSVVLKKGIYKSFNEFKFNNPSLPLNYEVVQAVKTLAPFTPNDDHVYYKLKADQIIEKNKEIFGFCDGSNVYINSLFKKFSKETEFEKVLTLGLYCFFEEIHNVAHGWVLENRIIDINTGVIYDLGCGKFDIKEGLITVVQDDMEILNEVKNHNCSKAKFLERSVFFKECIHKYSQKHKDRISEQPGIMSYDVLLFRESDINYQKYCDRVIESFSPFWEIKLTSTLKKDSIIVNRGLTVIDNGWYRCKIGLWQYFNKDGKLEKEHLYNMVGQLVETNEY